MTPLLSKQAAPRLLLQNPEIQAYTKNMTIVL